MLSPSWAASSRVGLRINARIGFLWCSACLRSGRGVLEKPLEDRQGEGSRLARARLGAAKHVSAFENGADRGQLNGRRLRVALGLNGGQERFVQSKGGKWHRRYLQSVYGETGDCQTN